MRLNSSRCDQVQDVEVSTPRITTQDAYLRYESGDKMHDALETDTSKELALIAGRVGFDAGLAH